MVIMVPQHDCVLCTFSDRRPTDIMIARIERRERRRPRTIRQRHRVIIIERNDPRILVVLW